jgi:hypothetical protein
LRWRCQYDPMEAVEHMGGAMFGRSRSPSRALPRRP